MAKIDSSQLADMSRAVSEAIQKGFADAGKKLGKSADLTMAINEQLDELADKEKAAMISAQVRNKMTIDHLSQSRAELAVAKENAVQQNNTSIQEKVMRKQQIEGLLKRKDLSEKFRDTLKEEAGDLKESILDLTLLNKGLTDQTNILLKKLEIDERQEEAAEKLREAAHAMKEVRESFLSQIGVTKELIDLFKTPELAKAVFAEQLVEKIGHVNHSMHELVDTGMQAGEAINLMREDFSLMSAMGLSKVSDVSKDLIANFGTAKVLTEAQRAAVGEMATNYGLAGEEAANLTMAISKMPGESKDSAVNFAKSADSIGKMKGVLPSQIMKEMAKNSGLMATFSKGGAEGFAKAAASAKKMGVELSSVASAAEKVLDFESSINSEMEASVLIGKELNFTRLREVSLSGDLNAVMEEQAKIMSQVGSLDQMNVLQKKALAEAMGITTEELVEMSEAQKFNNQYFGENSTMLDTLIGKSLKYGGALGGLVKEYGLLALSFIQTLPLIAGFISKLFTKTAATTADTASTITNTLATTANTTATGASIPITTAAGTAASTAGKSMLAMGAAILMIGAGIGAAAFGLAQLVSSFKDLTGPQILGALGSLVIVMGGFIGLVIALGAVGTVAGPGLLMIGGAILMIGAGIGLASAGIGYMVEQFGKIPYDNLMQLPFALMGIGAGLYMMGAGGLSALPVIGALLALGTIAPKLSGLGGGSSAGEDKDNPVVKALGDVKQAIADLATGLSTPVPIEIKLDGSAIAKTVYGYTKKPNTAN